MDSVYMYFTFCYHLFVETIGWLCIGHYYCAEKNNINRITKGIKRICTLSDANGQSGIHGMGLHTLQI